MRIPLLLVCLVAPLFLAACMGEPRPQTVDFSNAGQKQRGGDFQLHIRVVGLDNGTHPIPGAFVGAASGTQALARSTTDATGTAHIVVRRDQTLRVVGQAENWTTEDSGVLRIGDGGSSCRVMIFTDWCLVDDSNATTEIQLGGSEASIGLVLFRKTVRQDFDVALTPHARAGSVAAPDNRYWFPSSRPLAEDPDLHRLHMLRFEGARSTVTWTNALQSQADLELGVGCRSDAPQASTAGDIPAFAQQGEVRLDKDFEQRDDGPWSGCETFRAGPLVDSLVVGANVHVAVVMQFQGRSRIIPIT